MLCRGASFDTNSKVPTSTQPRCELDSQRRRQPRPMMWITRQRQRQPGQTDGTTNVNPTASHICFDLYVTTPKSTPPYLGRACSD